MAQTAGAEFIMYTEGNLAHTNSGRLIVEPIFHGCPVEEGQGRKEGRVGGREARLFETNCAALAHFSSSTSGNSFYPYHKDRIYKNSGAQQDEWRPKNYAGVFRGPSSFSERSSPPCASRFE